MKKTIKNQILDFVEKNGPTRRCEIIKKIREIQGLSFSPVRDRGYYSSALADNLVSNFYKICCGFTDNKPGYVRHLR